MSLSLMFNWLEQTCGHTQLQNSQGSAILPNPCTEKQQE